MPIDRPAASLAGGLQRTLGLAPDDDCNNCIRSPCTQLDIPQETCSAEDPRLVRSDRPCEPANRAGGGGVEWRARQARFAMLTTGAILLASSPQAEAQGSLDRTVLFSILDRGEWSTVARGTADSLRTAYGRIASADGSTTSSGVTIHDTCRSGALISEARARASEPVRQGRLFAWASAPANTGLALANPSTVPAEVDFDVTDTSGAGCAEGIAIAGGQFYVVGGSDEKIYAYDASGRRDPAADFDLAPDNDSPTGITFGNGRFHVTDWWDEKVYAYDASGRRNPAADFDLDMDNGPAGITFANGRFLVVDGGDVSGRGGDKAFAYDASGRRDPAADFDLDAANAWPAGITFANGRFHVANAWGEKVYGYDTWGRRDLDGRGIGVADFDLDAANAWPVGITFVSARFHVVDGGDDRVYAYDASGRRDATADFDLDAANGSPAGITFANGRFHVVDGGDDRVYAYDAPGRRDTGGGGTGVADLVAQTPSVSHSSPGAGGSITLRARVFSQGGGASGATTLRRYRYTNANATTSTFDTQVRTDAIGGLFVSGTSDASISQTAPSVADARYYGACVDRVSAESNLDDNCSVGVRLGVRGEEGFAPADERAFNIRTVGNCVIAQFLSIDSVSDGHFVLSGGPPGSFRYSNTDVDTGTPALTFGLGGRHLRNNCLTFVWICNQGALLQPATRNPTTRRSSSGVTSLPQGRGRVRAVKLALRAGLLATAAAGPAQRRSWHSAGDQSTCGGKN